MTVCRTWMMLGWRSCTMTFTSSWNCCRVSGVSFCSCFTATCRSSGNSSSSSQARSGAVHASNRLHGLLQTVQHGRLVHTNGWPDKRLKVHLLSIAISKSDP